MKHTPGPWEVFICDDGSEHTGWPISIHQAGTDKTVVRTGGQWPYTWDEAISKNEAVANANLIAAAPELLEALEVTMDLAWRDHKTPEEQAFLEKVDKLIIKAKGAPK